MRDFLELLGCVLLVVVFIALCVYEVVTGVAKDLFFVQEVGWWPW